MIDDIPGDSETLVPITRDEYVRGPLRRDIRTHEAHKINRDEKMVGRLLRSLRRSMAWAKSGGK